MKENSTNEGRNSRVTLRSRGVWGRYQNMISSLTAGLLILVFGAGTRAQESNMIMMPLEKSKVKESVERIARFTPLGYASTPTEMDGVVRWLQVDLGESVSIDKVKLFPYLHEYGISAFFFPIRFKIDASDDPEFKTVACIVDCTRADMPDPQDVVATYAASGVSGRYVRLTVTKMHTKERKFDLSKLEVWSKGRDLAEGRPISDSITGYLGITPLTRHPRPQGEGVFTDNVENVIPAKEWKPVAYQAKSPLAGVQLNGGPFEQAMRANIDYLLNSFTVNEMLREFRTRAGKPNPPDLRKPDEFWEKTLAGSCAGRFLMGAGNTLRWIEDAELRRRMNSLVDGIAECRQPNGYIMAYPEETIFTSERGAYVRAWLTHGLIEAGYAGNPKAFELLRGYYDWFNRSPYLPELLRRAGLGEQGMIANTRMYFTPVGKPEDLQVAQRYFQENYWLKQLANREAESIWKYPYDRPHSYLMTALEPYLDLYRATGKEFYLKAAQGGWELFHDNWQHVGGSFSIREVEVYPPKSNFLHKGNGEQCGSVFWILLNQRFHQLEPHKEKFVNEIEKSIYNVMLANLDGASIGWQTVLDGQKLSGSRINTCCEGMGTRLYGSLAEYVYTLADDGVFIDLFEASTLHHKIAGQAVTLKMETSFPFNPEVRISLKVAHPLQGKLNIRVPAWAAAKMPIMVNGVLAATGKPGSYAVLDRTWNDGDKISFSLPMAFKLTHYEGSERVAGQEQYALEFGPILMAVVGPMESTPGHFPTSRLRLAIEPRHLIEKLTPKPGQPLHFTIAGYPEHETMPYWKVAKQIFTCFPILEGAKP